MSRTLDDLEAILQRIQERIDNLDADETINKHLDRADAALDRALERTDQALADLDYDSILSNSRRRSRLKSNRKGNRSGQGKRYSGKLEFDAANGIHVTVRFNNADDMSIDCGGDLDMSVVGECQEKIRAFERDQILQSIAEEEDYNIANFGEDNREGPFLFGENWKGDPADEVTSRLVGISVGYASTRSFLGGLFFSAYPKYQAYIDFDDDGKHDVEIHMFEHEIRWRICCADTFEAERDSELDNYFCNWSEDEVRVMIGILDRVRDLGLEEHYHKYVIAALRRHGDADDSMQPVS